MPDHVQRAAKQLIAAWRSRASEVARARSDEARRHNDERTAAEWAEIKAAIEEIVGREARKRGAS
jgi:hypothetical protein